MKNRWKSLERDYRVPQVFSSGNEYVSNQNLRVCWRRRLRSPFFYCAALNRMSCLGLPESYKVVPAGKAA